MEITMVQRNNEILDVFRYKNKAVLYAINFIDGDKLRYNKSSMSCETAMKELDELGKIKLYPITSIDTIDRDFVITITVKTLKN